MPWIYTINVLFFKLLHVETHLTLLQKVKKRSLFVNHYLFFQKRKNYEDKKDDVYIVWNIFSCLFDTTFHTISVTCKNTMRINEYTVIFGEKVLLVPYESHHVPKYHGWMQGRELQKLTASEPLTLEEEYEMQKHWREDNDKCTFIILDLKNYQRHQGGLKDKEIDTMIGDVNLFFNEGESRDIAEVEIMIAEPSSRGKGLGKEALNTMMRYGMEVLHINKYVAKIGYSNQPSLGMFKKFGFEEVSRSDVFEEITLELYLTDEDKMRILENTPVYRIDVQGS